MTEKQFEGTDLHSRFPNSSMENVLSFFGSNYTFVKEHWVTDFVLSNGRKAIIKTNNAAELVGKELEKSLPLLSRAALTSYNFLQRNVVKATTSTVELFQSTKKYSKSTIHCFCEASLLTKTKYRSVVASPYCKKYSIISIKGMELWNVLMRKGADTAVAAKKIINWATAKSRTCFLSAKKLVQDLNLSNLVNSTTFRRWSQQREKSLDPVKGE